MFSDFSEKEKFKIIDETLKSPDNKLSIKKLCDIANVSRSGFYNWQNSSDKRELQEKADIADFSLILEAYKADNYKKGMDQIYLYFLHRKP